MFSILLLAAHLTGGMPSHDRPMQTFPGAPSCARGDEGCGASSEWKAPRLQDPPPRECPKGSSATTVTPGTWYCIPDRAIHE
ncbi:MAG TPA: hypothetical protein VHC39_12820 [Rhizomicrobium sp.]|nr:hypothetical protein [Rhizomicrobium sp.]